MNHITIVGRIGREPEQDVVAEGKERVRFSVAVNRPTKKGETAVTDWFDCTAFGKTGSVIKEYCHKGDQIIVEGQMQSYKGIKDPSKTYWGILVSSFEFGSKKNDSVKAETIPGFEADQELPF